jgi:hypothetical protein
MSKKNKKKLSNNAMKGFALGTALSLGTFGFTAVGTGAAFSAPTANTAAASLNTTKVIKLANGKTRVRVDLADNLRGKTVIIRTSRIVSGERRVFTLGKIKLTKTGKGYLTVSRQIRVDDRIIVRDGVTNIVNSKVTAVDDRTPAVPAPAPAPTPAPPASGGGSSGGGSASPAPTTLTSTSSANSPTLTSGVDTFITRLGSPATTATDSTVVFDIDATQAATAKTFSIKLAGVNADAAITPDVTDVADGIALATAIQAALRTADSNATDIIASWNADVLTITDAKGRDFTDASLIDTGDAEIDATITTTNGATATSAIDSFSSLANLDVLSGFVVGTDKVDLLDSSGGALAAPTSLTRVADVASSDDLTPALSGAFGSTSANTAGLVVISAGTQAGTYLYVRTGASFSATQDVFIKLVGVTPGAVGTLVVADYFTV